MRYIILLIILVPAAEIAVLLTAGQILGFWTTILLILLTGVVGAYLAKKQGILTFYQFQRQMQSGQLPGETLLDGVCILVGGTLLLTPGFITDTFGFLLLIPVTRTYFKAFLYKWFKNRIRNGNIKIIN